MKTRKTVPMNPTEGQEWSRRQESGPVAAAGRRGQDEWRRGTHAGTWPQRRQRWPALSEPAPAVSSTGEAALAGAVRAWARGELHGGGSAGGRCQTAQGLSLGLHGELRGWGAQREGPSVCSQLIHCAVHRNQHHTVEQCSN